MSAMARTGPVWLQEPGASYSFSNGWQGSQVSGSSSAILSSLAGHWIRSGVAKTWLGPKKGCWCFSQWLSLLCHGSSSSEIFHSLVYSQNSHKTRSQKMYSGIPCGYQGTWVMFCCFRSITELEKNLSSQDLNWCSDMGCWPCSSHLNLCYNTSLEFRFLI